MPEIVVGPVTPTLAPEARILPRKELTKALRAALAAATGRPFGTGKAPSGAKPYGILYPISGGGFSGPPLANPDEDATCIYQVTCVGIKVDSVEWLADRVRRTILGRGATGEFISPIAAPAGWAIIDRRPDTGPGGVDAAKEALYQQADRYALFLTPA